MGKGLERKREVGEMLILENGELSRQWEQHVQRLRGQVEADRLRLAGFIFVHSLSPRGFKNKEEDSVVGA